MSTRSTTHFTADYDTDVIIYRHSDGYPSEAGKDIYKFFLQVEADTRDTRFNDPNYLAAKYVVYLATKVFGNGNLDFLSVGVMKNDPSDIEYRYTVNCSEHDSNGRPLVTCVGVYSGKAEDIPGAPVIEKEPQDLILEAADSASAINIVYTKTDGRISYRTIVPSKISTAASGAEVVTAYDLEKQAPRTFRLDRMEIR